MRRGAAVLILLLAASASAEVLHLKDGSRVEGKLTVCDEEHCVVNKKRVLLATIAVIELQSGVAVAPAAEPGSIILTDGSVHPHRFTGLSLGIVTTSGGSEIDRKRVAASSFQPQQPSQSAPPPPSQPAPAPVPAPPSAPPAVPSPVAPPPLPPSSPRRASSRAATDPGPPHKRGAQWKGLIIGRLYGTVRNGGSVELMAIHIARFREWNIPMKTVFGSDGVKTIGRVSKLWAEESVVRNWIIVQGPGLYCSGDGHMIATTTVDSPQPSVIYDRQSPGDMASTFQFDVPVGKQMYNIGVPPHTEFEPERAQNYHVQCRGGHSFDMNYFPLLVGRPPLGPYIGIEDPESRYVEHGKMVGGYTVPNVLWRIPGAADDAQLTLMASWAVCREGVQCPPPPEVGEGVSSPGSTCSEGTQKDIAQTCEDTYMKMASDLIPYEAQLARLWKEVDQYWPHFQHAAASCYFVANIKKSLEVFLGMEAKALGGAGAAAEAALGQFHAAISGDYGKITSPLAGELEANFYPWKKTKKALKTLEKLKAFYDLYQQAMNDPNAAAATTLEMCTGMIGLETQRNAEKFLSVSRQAGELFRNVVAPKRNELRGKEIECLQSDYQAWRACRAAAECRKEDPALCGPNPYDQYVP